MSAMLPILMGIINFLILSMVTIQNNLIGPIKPNVSSTFEDNPPLVCSPENLKICDHAKWKLIKGAKAPLQNATFTFQCTSGRTEITINNGKEYSWTFHNVLDTGKKCIWTEKFVDVSLSIEKKAPAQNAEMKNAFAKGDQWQLQKQ